MRVLHVNHLLDPISGGGTAERTYQLTRFLIKEGVECGILTLDVGSVDKVFEELKPAQIHRLWCLNRRYFIPVFSIFKLAKLIRSYDAVHIMGHWTILNALAGICCLICRIPYVVCPAGALQNFGRSRYLKRIYDFVIGRRLIRSASAWVAITEAEKKDFLRYGISPEEITIIPNGIDLQAYLPDTNSDISAAGFPDKPYILFLGRLNLIKGPDLLLQAFIEIADQFKDVQLVLAGPDAGLRQKLENTAAASGYAERVHFTGHVAGSAKIEMIRHASCMVIPSRHEAMSIVVLEAGACKTPVIFTDQCGLDEFAALGAGVMVEPSSDALRGALELSLRDSPAAKAKARTLHGLITMTYQWGHQAKRYLGLYRQLSSHRRVHKDRILRTNTQLSYIYPLAFMANTFAMTMLFIVLGLAGRSMLAADVAMVQGASLALFYVFSANARSLVLSGKSPALAQSILAVRLVLMLPLAYAAYWLSVGMAGVAAELTILLLVRRCTEWLSEIHLSEMERLGQRSFAWGSLFAQSFSLLILLCLILLDSPYAQLGWLVWALIPLIGSIKDITEALLGFRKNISRISSSIFPHLGSTTIIGVTVYVFRLEIMLLVGKATAGDLFTAFAMGGLAGSVFANALGPSVALHEHRSGQRNLPIFISAALAVMLVLGAGLVLLAKAQWPILGLSGKDHFFWMAVGLSLVGGVVMVYAQRYRLRMLQHDEERDVFGPDVLMNILLIAAIPLTFYIVGRHSLGYMYLLSSILAYAFYRSAYRKEMKNKTMENSIMLTTRWVIASLILFPIFFQLEGGVFTDSTMIYDTGGLLPKLPIPISVMACAIGILLLGAYSRAKESLSVIFFTCLLMLSTTVLISNGSGVEERDKFIFLIQFLLPMFALVLGQIYIENDGNRSALMEKGFLCVLALVVPLELIQTWMQGRFYLSPQIFFFSFSVYQHLQYVPVVLISAFLIVLYQLGHAKSYRPYILGLTPIMGIYAVASTSVLAQGLFVSGLISYAVLSWFRTRDTKVAMVTLLAIALAFAYFLLVVSKASWVAEKYSISSRGGEKIVLQTANKKLMPGLAQRYDYWQYYLKESTINAETFFLGHAERPNRSLYPSAHNYYLDFVYNFGFLSLLPILFLIIYTGKILYAQRGRLRNDAGLLGLAMAVSILLLVDNSLKVSLRQPYPGIYTYFIWGVLLSRLAGLRGKRAVTTP